MGEDGTDPRARADTPATVAEPVDATAAETDRREPPPALLPGCLSFCLSGLALLLGGIGFQMLFLGLRDYFSGRHLTEPTLGIFLSLVFIVPAGLLGFAAYVLAVIARRQH